MSLMSYLVGREIPLDQPECRSANCEWPVKFWAPELVALLHVRSLFQQVVDALGISVQFGDTDMGP